MDIKNVANVYTFIASGAQLMRLCDLFLCVALALPATTLAQSLPVEARCEAAVQPGAEISLFGRLLVETPDLPTELQRINLMSNLDECFAYAHQQLDAYTRQHPDDHLSSFVVARFIWRSGNGERAMTLLERVVKVHPEFASGLVLLASLHRENRNYPKALEYLKRAQRVSPGDLWLNFNLTAIQFAADGSQDARRMLLEAVQHSKANPMLRSSSATVLAEGLPADSPDHESLLRAMLTFETGAFREQSLVKLANLLLRANRHAEARQTLAELGPLYYVSAETVHAMVAESYLREAAAIAAGITPANKALVDQAKREVGGDFTTLMLRLATDRELGRKLRPFTQGDQPLDPDARDAYGNNVLCAAVRAQDLEAVRAAIEGRIDANARCGAFTALGWAVMSYQPDPVNMREIIAVLLAGGSDPDMAMDAPARLDVQCAAHDWCREHVTPLFDAHRAKTR